MENYQNYERVILPNTEESLSKIVNKISDNSIVLDIGCGPGVLGKYLSKNKGCTVDGVDADKNSIELSKAFYRNTAVKNLETELITDVFPAGAYDYIILADILEHIVNPDKLLSQLKTLVKPGGTIIFSVPNITHLAAGFELLLGNFEYKNNGLLDNTHLKFYSKKSLLEKLKSFDLFPCEVDTVKKSISETEFNDVSTLFPSPWIDKLIASREDSLTYQWLVSTKVQAQNTNEVPLPSLDTSIVPYYYASSLYWSDKKNPQMAESRVLIGHLNKRTSDETVVDFYFSECAEDITTILQIRIDPISDKKAFLIASAEIRNSNGDILWKADLANIENEFYGAKLIENDEKVGCLFQANGEDPHWIPTIGTDVYRKMDLGCFFRLTMKVDESLISFYNKWMFEKWERIDVHLSKLDYFRSREIKLQREVDIVTEELRVLQNSKFWLMTLPAREFLNLVKRIRSAKGISGKIEQFKLGMGLVVENAIPKLKTIFRPSLIEVKQKLALADSHKIVKFKAVEADNSIIPTDIAVHVYVDNDLMCKTVSNYLENIPTSFALYVSTKDSKSVKKIEELFSGQKNIKSVIVKAVDNSSIGMNPMIFSFGNELSKHSLVLSIQVNQLSLDPLVFGGWQRYSLDSLIGSREDVFNIFKQFNSYRDIGVLFPVPFHPLRSYVSMIEDDTKAVIDSILTRFQENISNVNSIDLDFFPIGNMFWFRGKAIEPVIKAGLNLTDFKQEKSSVGSYAIERLIPYFAQRAGLRTESFLARSFLSPDLSALPIRSLKNYFDKGLVKPTIMFDHNGGGGTNVYTREAIKSHDQSLLRLYFQHSNWIVQWVRNDDGGFFYTESVEELFEVIASSGVSKIIVNSLYGFADIKETVSKIIKLSASSNAPIDFKIHDFYPVCVSPHLIDYRGSYCGIPNDQKVCQNCLSKNLGWYHVWYPERNRPHEISQWREPFAELFKAADTITFFNSSSVNLISKAFHLDEAKIKIIPHKLEYLSDAIASNANGEVRIGIMGTLTQVKGAEIINSLQRYISNRGLNIPITVVGSSLVKTIDSIKVHGKYEQHELPHIINHYGISVILMPSIVPETFSYTISEAIKLKLPIVAFDIGAQGNRVKDYELGVVVPFGSPSDVILDAIYSVHDRARRAKK